MSLLIIIDKTFANDYFLKYYDILYNKALEIKSVLNADLRVIEKDEIKTQSTLEYASGLYNLSKDYSDILYLRADAPMIYVNESIKLIKAHKDSMSYYTYGENYPKGIMPFIFRVSAFERLIDVLKKSNVKLDYNFIENIVMLDPNFFEVEVLISEFDMRYYRLEFFADSKRNSILIDNFIDCDSYDVLVSSVKKNHEKRRTLPAYFEIDISSYNNAIHTNTPVQNVSIENNMSLANFKKVYDEIKNLCDDFHLSIGSFYEPMINESWYDILEYAINYNKANIYFETNAIKLDSENAKKLIDLQNRYKNLHVIFHLDTVDDVVYKKIYSSGDIKTILSNLEYYLLRKVDNVYMYIIKQKQNFDYLKQYYFYFEKYKVKIIMQKYSTYRGTLSDEKVGDMKPLVFVGCSHLLRDMYIGVGGVVPICKYDNKKDIVLGNVFEDKIKNIWDRGYLYYQKNVDKNMSFCSDCDDWYLYNF